MRTRKCRTSEPNRPRSPAKMRFERRPAARSSVKIGTFSARHYLGSQAELHPNTGLPADRTVSAALGGKNIVNVFFGCSTFGSRVNIRDV